MQTKWLDLASSLGLPVSVEQQLMLFLQSWVASSAKAIYIPPDVGYKTQWQV